MTTASLKLCKELYKLKPEWNDTENHYFILKDGNAIPVDRPMDKFTKGYNRLPAYDTDYLLDKMKPKQLAPNSLEEVTIAIMHKNWGIWRAYYERKYDSHDDLWLEKEADIPANALCKLAIELINKGVL